MTLTADVTTAQGLKSLDTFLSDKSYIEGYQASQADVSIFQNIKTAPTSVTPHALRWYNHIKSYEKVLASLPGEKKITPTNQKTTTQTEEDDEDVDLFGSDDEEDAEAAKVREQRLKEYAEKKSKKPVLIAKSSIVLDVKPWDDETDMSEMEKQVRTIVMDGLVWGASNLVPVGYGIKKLQIMCVVEDDKVSVDLLTEKIQDFEDFVQSVDIAAFNKI